MALRGDEMHELRRRTAVIGWNAVLPDSGACIMKANKAPGLGIT